PILHPRDQHRRRVAELRRVAGAKFATLQLALRVGSPRTRLGQRRERAPLPRRVTAANARLPRTPTIPAWTIAAVAAADPGRHRAGHPTLPRRVAHPIGVSSRASM